MPFGETHINLQTPYRKAPVRVDSTGLSLFLSLSRSLSLSLFFSFTLSPPPPCVCMKYTTPKACNLPLNPPSIAMMLLK